MRLTNKHLKPFRLVRQVFELFFKTLKFRKNKTRLIPGNKMKTVVLFSVMVLMSVAPPPSTMNSCHAQADNADEADAKEAIVELLNRYRRAAANSDAKEFFGCFDEHSITFWTDEAERFTLPELKTALAPYFEKGVAWKRTVRDRHVYLGPNQQIGWFEEKTEREGVPMRTTGVVQKTEEGWKIVQSNTAFAIPNGIYPQIVELVRDATEEKNENLDSADK